MSDSEERVRKRVIEEERILKRRRVRKRRFLAAGLFALAVVAAGAALFLSQPRETLDQMKADQDRAEQALHEQVSPAPKHPGYRKGASATLRCNTGIYESEAAPLPAALYTISNRYTGRVGHRCVTVFAGKSLEAGLPVLVIVSSGGGVDSLSEPSVQLGKRPGAARIVTKSGGLLKVRTSSEGLLKCRLAADGCAIISP